MIHLLWSTINTIIVIYFLYLIIGFIRKGKRIFDTKFKAISIFIMIIGIIQIITYSQVKENNNRVIITENYSKLNNLAMQKVILEDNLTFDINMLVTYSIDKNEFIPIESYSSITGFVSGYTWEAGLFEIDNYKPNEKVEFYATGILKWNLFGTNFYSENKTFRGIIKLEKPVYNNAQKKLRNVNDQNNPTNL